MAYRILARNTVTGQRVVQLHLDGQGSLDSDRSRALESARIFAERQPTKPGHRWVGEVQWMPGLGRDQNK